MINEVIFQIKQNYELYQYLKYNSDWYKVLTYNPEKINDFIKEYKEKNKLTLNDKISDLNNKVSMISSLLQVIN